MNTDFEHTSLLPPPTLSSGAYYDHQLNHCPEFCTILPSLYDSSQWSYAILPLSPQPLLSSPPAHDYQTDTRLWTHPPNTSINKSDTNKRVHDHLVSESSGQQQKQPQKYRPRKRAKLRQPLMHRQPNTLTKTIWVSEHTICYQVDAKGICVTRRGGNNGMVNGTKLLNAVGISRGKRDGILKNIRRRRVVKVGAMVLKGVWIPIEDARELAVRFVIEKDIFPLLEPCPEKFLARSPFSLSSSLSISPSSSTSSSFDTAIESGTPSPDNPVQVSPATQPIPIPMMEAPVGVSFSTDLQQLGLPNNEPGGIDAEHNHSVLMQNSPPSPMLSSLSSIIPFTVIDPEVPSYHSVPMALPTASYMHPDMMYGYPPKYPASADTYNAYFQQQQQQQQQQQHHKTTVDFDADAFLLA
ncbi:hypothetical protein BX666DRAFT_1916486 [Dichotomocladium elegans]|nr:hypothetical protein BX666DRAFT_1916486 [Dichotomocladium elegans]